MSELRLYAISIEEVRGIFGAPAERAAQLREIAAQALAPTPTRGRTGLGAKLGPLFRRPPNAPVLSPGQPEPADLEALLTGAPVPAARSEAVWALVEVLMAGLAWDSTRLTLNTASLTDLDVALIRTTIPVDLPLTPLAGFTVSRHSHDTVRVIADAYRSTTSRLPAEQKLMAWLDGFGSWAQAATASGRPVPDLVTLQTN